MATIEEAKVFLFNLETTGLYPHYPKVKKQDFCQIGVLSHPDAISFCRYVVPSIEIEPTATAVSGLSSSYQNGEKVILLKEQEVTNTVTKFQAITDFLDFLKANSEPGSTICLVGYCSDKHDIPFLKDAFDDCKIPMVIEGRTLTTSDAFPLLWKVAEDIHDPLGQKLSSCENKKRQTAHRKMFMLCNDEDTHDAMRDVEQLRDIITHSDFPFNRLIFKHIGSTDDLVAKTTKPIAQELSTHLPPKPNEAEKTAIQKQEVYNPSKKRKSSSQEIENDVLRTSKKMRHGKADKPLAHSQ